MKKHKLSKKCWCNPKVEDYRKKFPGVVQEIKTYQETLAEWKRAYSKVEEAMQMVGATIKLTRKSSGMTLRKFADELGISHAYLDDLERGKRKLSEKMIKKLSR